MEYQYKDLSTLSALPNDDFFAMLPDDCDPDSLRNIYLATSMEEAVICAGKYLESERSTSFDMCMEFVGQRYGVGEANEPDEISEEEMIRRITEENRQHHENVAFALEALKRALASFGLFAPSRLED